METTSTRSEPAAPRLGNGSAPVDGGDRPKMQAQDREGQDLPEILGNPGLVDDKPLEGALSGGAPDTAEATVSQAPDDAAKINVLAGAIGLMMASPRYMHLFLADLEWVLLPPLALKQYRLFTKASRPVAFASWAYVSEEVETRLKAGQTKLKPAEWRSGNRCRIVDVVAPYGGEPEIRTELHDLWLAECARKNAGSVADH